MLIHLLVAFNFTTIATIVFIVFAHVELNVSVAASRTRSATKYYTFCNRPTSRSGGKPVGLPLQSSSFPERGREYFENSFLISEY